MARLLYGCTAADYTITSGGRVIPNTELTVWDAIEGGTQITDLTDYDGNAVGTVTSEGTGFVRFYGPDGENDNLWLDSGQNSRVLVRPTVITADLGDGSILDEDINAAADIDRTKIAGTALTAESMGIFNVKDYGAVGDGTTDDTTAIRAALTAVSASGRIGGTVWFPQGTYRITGSLTIASENVHIRGTGKRNVLQYPLPASDAGSASTIYNDHTGPLFHLLHSNETWGFNVADITLLGKTANFNGTDYHAFDFDLAGDGHAIRHITVTNVAIALFNTPFMARATTAEGTGAASQLMLFTATHCDIHHNKWIAQCLNGVRWNGFWFHDNDATQNGYEVSTGGLSLGASCNVSIHDNCLEGQRDPIKLVNHTQNLSIRNNYFEGNVGVACIQVSGSQSPVDIGPNLYFAVQDQTYDLTHRVLLSAGVYGRCEDVYYPDNVHKITPRPGARASSRYLGAGAVSKLEQLVTRLDNSEMVGKPLVYTDSPKPEDMVAPRNVLTSLTAANAAPKPTAPFIPDVKSGSHVPVLSDVLTADIIQGIIYEGDTFAADAGQILVATFCYRRVDALIPVSDDFNLSPYIALRPDNAANEYAETVPDIFYCFRDDEWVVTTVAMLLTHACTSVASWLFPYGNNIAAVGLVAEHLPTTYYTVADVNDVKPWIRGYGQATIAPTGGTWAVGDEVVNAAPAAAGAHKWVCTSAGTPGTWKPLSLGA